MTTPTPDQQQDPGADAMGKIRDSFAASPLRAGYAAGRQLYEGGPAWDNGDGGDNDLATKTDLQEHSDALSSKMDAMSGAMSRSAAFGQGNGSQAAPQASGTQRPNAPSARPNVLADMAQHHASMLGQMQDAHTALRAGQDRRSAINAQRQSSGGMNPVQPTGNAMGGSTSEASMAGLLGRQAGGGISSNGSSSGTFENVRFGK